MDRQWWKPRRFRQTTVRHGVLLEVLERAADVVGQQAGHVAAHAVADEDALHDGVLPVGRQRIRRDLPAAHPHAIRQVVEREARAVAGSFSV